MKFDVSLVHLSDIASFAKKSDALAAAKAAGFGEARDAYTRFTACWIVGAWEGGYANLPDHLVMLTRDGGRVGARITRGMSCLRKPGALVLGATDADLAARVERIAA